MFAARIARGDARASISPASRHGRWTTRTSTISARRLIDVPATTASVHLRVAGGVRPERLAADKPGRGVGRRPPPAPHGLDPSRCRRTRPTPCSSIVSRARFCRHSRNGALLPQQAGLLLVADGQGDPATRADSYRLMRLLWEQAGLGLRRGRLRSPLAAVPPRPPWNAAWREPLDWLLLPQCQWDGESVQLTPAVMLGDHQRAHPEATEWRLLDPPRDHPAIRAWLEQRLLRLWQDKRARAGGACTLSQSTGPARPTAGVWSGTDWVPVGEADPYGPGGIARAGTGIRRTRRDPRAGASAGRSDTW